MDGLRRKWLFFEGGNGSLEAAVGIGALTA